MVCPLHMNGQILSLILTNLLNFHRLAIQIHFLSIQNQQKILWKHFMEWFEKLLNPNQTRVLIVWSLTIWITYWMLARIQLKFWISSSTVLNLSKNKRYFVCSHNMISTNDVCSLKYDNNHTCSLHHVLWRWFTRILKRIHYRSNFFIIELHSFLR
jgi:hypothetical protein